MGAGLFRSAGRWAGLALAVAVAVIAAQGVFIAADLQREAALHREVIAGQAARDGLERLRFEVAELMHAARIAALTGEAAAFQDIERLGVEIDADLAYLNDSLAEAEPLPGYQALSESARLLSLRARSIHGIRDSQGAQAGIDASAGAARIAEEALAAARQAIGAETSRLNERMIDRLRVGEGIRAAVQWTLGGAVLVLLGLFVAYRRARLREADALRQVEHLAHWDTVTGLPNRSLLEDRLSQEVARARRSNQPLSVIMFDLDGFKAVNDTLGHAAGDRLLAIVGDRCRECIRESDTIGRVSGDEFLAILPESAVEGAQEVGEKLRAAIARPYEIDGRKAAVTASLGIACFPAHGGDADALRVASDAALYDAKRSGKNRVRVAAEHSAPAPREDGVPA